jgi:glycosyltransferase involved in cell wall biosynthesis
MVYAGVTGELVPPNDPAPLADALEKILRESTLARELGARGRALAAEKFAIEANVRALAEILTQRR